MTTIETLGTVNLTDACERAGVNGTIRRLDQNFVVGQDFSGNWTLSRFGGAPERITTYLTDGWTVVSTCNDGEEPTPTPETVRDFFANNVPLWTLVAPDHGRTRYVYTGIDWDSDGQEVIRLFHSRYFHDVELATDTLALPNAYTIVNDDDGNPVECDQLSRQLIRQLRGNRADLERAQERYESTAERLAKAEQDFHTVNMKINEYANETQMCSDYERRIYGWNTDLVHLQLEGRTDRNFTFHVPVRLPALAGDNELFVSIDGREHGIRSPKQAREYVENMSNIEILRNLYSYSNVQLEVVHLPDSEVNY